MIRKIVILVLVISAGVIAWAGIAELAGSGFSHPTLILSYLVILFSLLGIADSIRRLSQVDRETTRAHNRILHQIKWVGLATCLSLMLVHSSAMDWYLGTAQGPSIVDDSWWQHLWIIFIVVAPGTAGLAAYLRWAERPFPPGHCQSCGYALTGNLSGICPECGTAINTTKGTADSSRPANHVTQK